MPVVPVKLSDVSASDVATALTQQTAYIAESFPGADPARGPFSDLVLLTSSELAAVATLEIDRLQRSASLSAIAADPALADTQIVDAAVSNHNIARTVGAQASGSITMLVSNPASVIIPAGAVFVAAGLSFTTPVAFTASATASAIRGTTDRLMTSVPGGNYSFTFTVVAAAVGVAGNITQSTEIIPQSPPAYFVTCYAAADFGGGADTETNAALVARVKIGDSAKSGGGALNYLALIKSQPEFANSLYYSFVGLGDAEMRRDRYGLLPVSRGGCVDVYARPAPLPITVTAQLVASYTGATMWQVSIPSTILPGFYSVTSITNVGDTSGGPGFTIVSDIRGRDSGIAAMQPGLPSLSDSRYSTWQTASVQFSDPATPGATAVGSQKNVVVFLTGMPNIADLQSLFTTAGTKPLGTSVFVKAAIPCNVAVGLTVKLKPGIAAPDSGILSAAVAGVVNALDFGDALYTSLIDGAVVPLLTPGQTLTRIELLGSIIDTNGNTQALLNDRELVIPTQPDILVSPATTAFFLNPRNVTIALV